jgi:hypothetical protein
VTVPGIFFSYGSQGPAEEATRAVRVVNEIAGGEGSVAIQFQPEAREAIDEMLAVVTLARSRRRVLQAPPLPARGQGKGEATRPVHALPRRQYDLHRREKRGLRLDQGQFSKSASGGIVEIVPRSDAAVVHRLRERHRLRELAAQIPEIPQVRIGSEQDCDDPRADLWQIDRVAEQHLQADRGQRKHREAD